MVAQLKKSLLINNRSLSSLSLRVEKVGLVFVNFLCSLLKIPKIFSCCLSEIFCVFFFFVFFLFFSFLFVLLLFFLALFSPPRPSAFSFLTFDLSSFFSFFLLSPFSCSSSSFTLLIFYHSFLSFSYQSYAGADVIINGSCRLTAKRSL